MQTSALGAELELKALIGELYGEFRAADAPGTLSLLDRLTRAYRYQVVPRSEGDRAHRPPGARPPGADAAMLARDEIEEIVVWWAAHLHPVTAIPLARRDAANLLPTLAVQQQGGEMAFEVVHDLRSAHRVALLVLGLEDAPRTLQGADAPRCLHCRRQSISFDRNATRGDVWCGNGGWRPQSCHDDTRWPDCRDDTGLVTCRRSARSVRHAYRWDHASLPLLAPVRPA